jgi:hypothetical protein
VIGYLSRSDVLAARARLHTEEELRERGPLFRFKRTKDAR